MAKRNYEFGLVDKKQQAYLIAAKLFLAAMIALSFFLLVEAVGEGEEYLQHIAGVLIMVFMYINILQEKHELRRVFEPPYPTLGVEFVIVGAILHVTEWFL